MRSLPRGHRYRLDGQVWHLTHHCHCREFLLRLARDRRVWRSWRLYGARAHFGRCVPNGKYSPQPVWLSPACVCEISPHAEEKSDDGERGGGIGGRHSR